MNYSGPRAREAPEAVSAGSGGPIVVPWEMEHIFAITPSAGDGRRCGERTRGLCTRFRGCHMTTLPPCPTCGRTKYRYGFGWLKSVSLGVNLTALVAGVGRADVASIVAGGGGYFLDLLRLVGQAMDGIPQPPLLRCTHCQVFAIVCPHCQKMQVMDAQPRTGALLRCGSCQGAFGHAERDDAFDALVQP